MIVWRLAYFDADFGTCYAWAPTQRDAATLATRIKRHYAVLGFVPEVLPAVRVELPLGRGPRAGMVAWLNQNLARAPAPARATDPVLSDVEWRTATGARGAHLPNIKRQRATAESD